MTAYEVVMTGLRILETRTAQIIQELGFMLDDMPQDGGAMMTDQQQQQPYGAPTTNGYYGNGSAGINGTGMNGGGW